MNLVHTVFATSRPMRRSRALLAALAGAATLAGCASAPLSYLVGEPLTQTDFTLYAVSIVSVDGGIKFGAQPVQVAPGAHWLVLQAAPGRGARSSLQKGYVLKVEPCTRYFLAARRVSPMDADWSLVIDRTETVAGCSPEEELRKAAASAPAASATSAASK
ncbi:MAG: hypothetical protein KF891_07540 [Rhizobacter sp.]|nr:hypothetical protein [Rhizobacter sp.]